MQKSKLKKRLRKKYHLNEFQKLGFEVLVNFKKEMDETRFDRFRHRFIGEIESHGLVCGGGGDYNVWQAFVTSAKKFESPKNIEKEKIKTWLQNHSGIESFNVGEFKDAWND